MKRITPKVGDSIGDYTIGRVHERPDYYDLELFHHNLGEMGNYKRYKDMCDLEGCDGRFYDNCGGEDLCKEHFRTKRWITEFAPKATAVLMVILMLIFIK